MNMNVISTYRWSPAAWTAMQPEVLPYPNVFAFPVYSTATVATTVRAIYNEQTEHRDVTRS